MKNIFSAVRFLALAVILLAGAAGAARAQTNHASYQSPGTHRMAQRLRQVVEEADPVKDMFLSRERVVRLRPQLARATNLQGIIQLQPTLALELLNAGESAEALALFQDVQRRIRESGGSFGVSPLRQEIGLGKAETILAAEIFWPKTGRTQVLKGLAMDHFYKVREGDAAAILWPLKTFKFVLTPEKFCGLPVRFPVLN